MSDHYRAPGWFTRNVFNRLVAFLTRQGISVLGSRVLAVKGRRSGQWRTTPVNLLTYDGRRYLVAPRGETQWVRNLRAVGTGELRLGRRAESFRGRELTDDEKVPLCCAPTSRGGRRRSGSSSRAPGQTPATTRSAPSHPSTRHSRYFLSNRPSTADGFRLQTGSACITGRVGTRGGAAGHARRRRLLTGGHGVTL